VLETGFRKSHLRPNRNASGRSVVNNALLIAAVADRSSCVLPHPKCVSATHLAVRTSFYPSPYTIIQWAADLDGQWWALPRPTIAQGKTIAQN